MSVDSLALELRVRRVPISFCENFRFKMKELWQKTIKASANFFVKIVLKMQSHQNQRFPLKKNETVWLNWTIFWREEFFQKNFLGCCENLWSKSSFVVVFSENAPNEHVTSHQFCLNNSKCWLFTYSHECGLQNEKQQENKHVHTLITY